MRKLLIVYSSKTGTTQDAANSLASTFALSCDLHDCRHSTSSLMLDYYEVIVLGTAMYMGRPMKEFIKFCERYETELRKKKLILFTCGVGTQEEDKEYLWQALPNSITQKAIKYLHLGGEIREDKMDFFSRMAMKAYVKKHGNAQGINQVMIEEIRMTIRELLLVRE